MCASEMEQRKCMSKDTCVYGAYSTVVGGLHNNATVKTNINRQEKKDIAP